MKSSPPPPPPNTSNAHTEVADQSPQARASGNAAGKKRWSKPVLRLIEDADLQETGTSRDPDLVEDHLYYIQS